MPDPDKPDQNQKLKTSLAEHAEDAEFKTKTRKSFMANYFLIFSASSAPLREILLPFCKEFYLLVTQYRFGSGRMSPKASYPPQSSPGLFHPLLEKDTPGCYNCKGMMLAGR
jgi:hypothetical protein